MLAEMPAPSEPAPAAYQVLVEAKVDVGEMDEKGEIAATSPGMIGYMALVGVR